MAQAPGEEVRLVPHDPEWATSFQKERERLVKFLGDLILEIEHTGSTSVPGMPAKPIIDILVAVRNVQDFRLKDIAISRLGYKKTDFVQSEQHQVYSKGTPTTHHIHFVRSDTLKDTSHPKFRDRLKSDHHLALEYAALKADLAEKFRNDPRGYSREKGHWIRLIMDETEPKVDASNK